MIRWAIVWLRLLAREMDDTSIAFHCKSLRIMTYKYWHTKHLRYTTAICVELYTLVILYTTSIYDEYRLFSLRHMILRPKIEFLSRNYILILRDDLLRERIKFRGQIQPHNVEVGDHASIVCVFLLVGVSFLRNHDQDSIYHMRILTRKFCTYSI